MAKGSFARLHNFQPSPFLVALLAPIAPFGFWIHFANFIGRQTPPLRATRQGQRLKRKATENLSVFPFHISALYNKKGHPFKDVLFYKSGDDLLSHKAARRAGSSMATAVSHA